MFSSQANLSLSVYKLVAGRGEARRDFKLYKNLQLLLFSPIQFASFILTMNLLETKVVTLVILAVVSFLIGLSTIPLRFELRKVEQQTKDLWT